MASNQTFLLHSASFEAPSDIPSSQDKAVVIAWYLKEGDGQYNAPSPSKTGGRRLRTVQRTSRRIALPLHTLVIVFSLFSLVSCKTAKGPLLNFLSKNHGHDSEKAPSMCRAHSHNDYHQADPLSSALSHGMKSVEVDVFPRKGCLWVAHTPLEFDPKRTIDSLYIQPLLDIFSRKKDSSVPQQPQERPSVSVPVHARSASTFQRKWLPFSPRPARTYPSPRGGSDKPGQQKATSSSKVDKISLLVDFKGDPDKSASMLQVALAPLKPFLSKVDRNGVFRPGRLTVLISGNRPNETSLRAPNGERFLFLDGRVKDVRGNADTSLVPMVSVPWRQVRLARALGRGERYMKRLTEQAHAQGKLVRIWGAPNREQSWRQMVRGNIDFLSIDDHARFARFVYAKNLFRFEEKQDV